MQVQSLPSLGRLRIRPYRKAAVWVRCWDGCGVNLQLRLRFADSICMGEASPSCRGFWEYGLNHHCTGSPRSTRSQKLWLAVAETYVQSSVTGPWESPRDTGDVGDIWLSSLQYPWVLWHGFSTVGGRRKKKNMRSFRLFQEIFILGKWCIISAVITVSWNNM